MNNFRHVEERTVAAIDAKARFLHDPAGCRKYSGLVRALGIEAVWGALTEGRTNGTRSQKTTQP